MLKQSVYAAVAAMSAFSAGAQAQDPISNPRGSIANFDPGALMPILSELGVQPTLETASNGEKFIGCRAGNLKFTVHPAACRASNGTNCVGALALATFSGYALNYQSVSAFDERYAFADAGIYSGGTVAYVGRYDIADYGIARGNIAISLSNFIGLAELFWKELESGAKTVSVEGYAEDLMAASLNRSQLPEGAQGVPNPHALAIERIKDFAGANVAAGADNRKILNE